MSSFSVSHWIIVGVIVYVLYRVFARRSASGAPAYCKTCGHTGATTTKTPGSLGIEIVLWLLLIVPGVIYSVWRLSARKPACTACGSVDIVPADSPVAVAARKQLGQ
jgi:hypothetical protein